MTSAAILQRLKHILRCPRCTSDSLEFGENQAVCVRCRSVAHIGRTVDFRTASNDVSSSNKQLDFLARSKERLKNLCPKLYEALIQFVSPVYSSLRTKDFLEQFDLSKDIVIDLGSGCARLRPDIITVDMMPYTEVDITCCAESLPFKDKSINGIVSIALLEHVCEPEKVIAEMFRVLVPGGRIYCCIPFMQGVHASPDDYQRYAPSGLRHLFRHFEEVKIEVAAGPTSSVLWLLQEWLSMLLSGGLRPLYWLFYFLLFLASPLKFLDAILVKHPYAANIASSYSISAIKGCNDILK